MLRLRSGSYLMQQLLYTTLPSTDILFQVVREQSKSAREGNAMFKHFRITKQRRKRWLRGVRVGDPRVTSERSLKYAPRELNLGPGPPEAPSETHCHIQS